MHNDTSDRQLALPFDVCTYESGERVLICQNTPTSNPKVIDFCTAASKKQQNDMSDFQVHVFKSIKTYFNL